MQHFHQTPSLLGSRSRKILSCQLLRTIYPKIACLQGDNEVKKGILSNSLSSIMSYSEKSFSGHNGVQFLLDFMKNIGLDASSSNIMQFACLDATIDALNKILFKVALNVLRSVLLLTPFFSRMQPNNNSR